LDALARKTKPLIMNNVINFQDYKEKLKEAELKAELIKKLNTKMNKDEVDYTFLQILDLFCQRHQPDIYWRFELFINGKLD
jgi:hypothetical protein